MYPRFFALAAIVTSLCGGCPDFGLPANGNANDSGEPTGDNLNENVSGEPTGDNLNANVNCEPDGDNLNSNVNGEPDPGPDVEPTWNEQVMGSGIPAGTYRGQAALVTDTQQILPDGSTESTHSTATLAVTITIGVDGRFVYHTRDAATNVEEELVFDGGVATRNGTPLDPSDAVGFTQDVGLYAREGAIRWYWDFATRGGTGHFGWELRRRTGGGLQMQYARIGSGVPPGCCPSSLHSTALAFVSADGP